MWITSKSFDRCFPNKFEVNLDHTTRCTKCWSNLTLKSYAYSFVKAQVEEECRRTIFYLKEYSYLLLYYNKMDTNQKSTRRQLAVQKEKLCAECGGEKNFCLSKLLCIFPFFSKKISSKAKYAGQDGLVSVMQVSRRDQHRIRPITRLYPLNFAGQQEYVAYREEVDTQSTWTCLLFVSTRCYPLVGYRNQYNKKFCEPMEKCFKCFVAWSAFTIEFLKPENIHSFGFMVLGTKVSINL